MFIPIVDIDRKKNFEERNEKFFCEAIKINSE